jgi:hypothetical protein
MPTIQVAAAGAAASSALCIISLQPWDGVKGPRKNMKHAALLILMGLVPFCSGCSAMPADAQEVENKLYRGRFMMFIADNFEQQIAKIHYQLITDEDGQSLSLEFSDPRDIPNVKSGTRVEIMGRQQNGHIAVDTLRILVNPEGKKDGIK